MLIDDQRLDQIKEVFKQVYEYQELAKNHSATSRELMKGLVESITVDKKERKEVKKILSKAFKEWVEDAQGEPETTVQALEVAEKLKS